MTATAEAFELVASLLALQVAKATAMLTAQPGDFSNGYRAAVIDCLGLTNELVRASRQPDRARNGKVHPG
jgi:hypothetical protein